MTTQTKVLIIASAVVVTVTAVIYFHSQKIKKQLQADIDYQNGINAAIQNFTTGNHWGWLVKDYIIKQVNNPNNIELLLKRIYTEPNHVTGIEPRLTWDKYNYSAAIPYIQAEVNKQLQGSGGILGALGDIGKIVLHLAPLAL